MKSASLFSREALLVNFVAFLSVMFWSDMSLAASLILKWKDASSNETGFKVERALGTTGSFSQVGTVDANVQSYTDPSVSSGKTYCYRVRAYNSNGSSTASNQACANVASTTVSTVSLGSGSGSTSNSGSTSSSTSGSIIPISTSTTIQNNDAPWTNYRFKVKLKSNDNDTIGVMFRYQDQDNYYRFLWSKEGSLRRLEKQVNGRFSTLSEDVVPYNQGQTYELEIIAKGNTLRVRIDDSEIFYNVDSSLTRGTVALYTCHNTGNYFDDVLVQDFNGATLLRENFEAGRANGWLVVDEGLSYGPSKWAIFDGTLVQSSNIGSSARGDFLGTYALYTN
ncbi:MAG: fibronectin type III domain-containing protein [Candidatus Binatia bacterium]